MAIVIDCYQHYGATCHTAEAIIDVLRSVFEDRIISHRADVVWPPRSCDLIPLDYYLLQFKVDFERQIFGKLFMAILFILKVFARRRVEDVSKMPMKYFSIFHFI